jgi:hypothetical protein
MQFHVRPFAIITGFLLLSTAVAIPLLLKKQENARGPESDENIRYDIDDYMAAEGL